MSEKELWETQRDTNEFVQGQIIDLCDIVLAFGKVLKDHEDKIKSLEQEISKLKGES